MAAYQNIKTETKGRVGIIRLDRPKALNALCADLVRELGQALDVFVAAVRHYLGAYLLLLNGADAIVFTGGIGENAAPVRKQVIDGLRWLGFEVDDEANAAGRKRITKPESRIPAYVIATDEELMIARHTRDAVRAMA